MIHCLHKKPTRGRLGRFRLDKAIGPTAQPNWHGQDCLVNISIFERGFRRFSKHDQRSRAATKILAPSVQAGVSAAILSTQQSRAYASIRQTHRPSAKSGLHDHITTNGNVIFLVGARTMRGECIVDLPKSPIFCRFLVQNVMK